MIDVESVRLWQHSRHIHHEDLRGLCAMASCRSDDEMPPTLPTS